ncbi:MAG: DUF5011 domain-containing protein [Candidatus Niyogibacteria bacterium]|nr:MAG: DUF5011 domain-containing protein [Candidatus Niyogibacteria bacterium]
MARHQIPKIWRNDKEFLSLTYAASFAGYHKERLRQLIKENKLSAERINGVWFIEKSVLQNFITENTGIKRISELPKLDSDTQKSNSKSIYKFFSAWSKKSDPWDTLLLGDDYSKTSSFKKLSDFLKPIIQNAFLWKSSALILLVILAGFFILRNPDAALAKYHEFKNAMVSAVSDIVPNAEKLVFLSLNSLKAKGADIQKDILHIIDQGALVLDNSFEKTASVMEAPNLKRQIQNKLGILNSKFNNLTSAVSDFDFQGFKVSKFKIFSKFQFPELSVSKFKTFSELKVPELNISKSKILSKLEVPEFKAPNFKISEFKIPKVKLPNFNFAKASNDVHQFLGQVSAASKDAVFGMYQSILESRSLEWGKKAGSYAIDGIESIPLKIGKYAGSLTSRGVDKALEKTKETLVGIYDKTFEVLTRLPEPPEKDETVMGERGEKGGEEKNALKAEQAEEILTLRSQGLEPSVSVGSSKAPAIIERVVERTVVQTASASGTLTKEQLDLALSGVNARILAEVSELKSLIAKRANDNFAAIALTNRIDRLSGVTLSNVTVDNISSLDDDDIPNDITISTSKSFSGTSANFSSNVTITGSLSASTLSIPNASSSLSSIFKTLYIGGVATTTFSTTASSFDITANATTTLGTTGLNIGSDQFVIQQNSGRVGISTSSPSVTLHLEEADGTNSGLAIGGDGVTSSARLWIGDSTNLWRIQTSSGNLLYTSGAVFGTNNGTERFRLQSSGNFGIASSTPWGLLSVNPDALGASVPSFVVGSSSATSFIIDTGGKVGIGTTSPYAKLSVEGQTVSSYFTATSTAFASTLPYASTTAITATTASTTNQVISSLISGRIPYASTAGLLIDNSALTFDGTRLTATYASTTAISGTNIDFGTLTLTNALGIASGGTNASSFTTSGNAVYYDGTSLLTAPLASAITIPYASTTALTISGTASTTNLLASSLTSGRVPYITTAGLFTDDSDLTFNGSILTATYASSTALTVSGTASTTNQVFSAMTSGSVLFAGTGGLLSQDNSNLFWDDTNNRLGIASTTPWGLLSLNPNALGAGIPSFVIASSSNAAYFIIDNGGQVGVGTSSPYAKFSLSGTTDGTEDIFAIATSSTAAANTTTLRVNSTGQLQFVNQSGDVSRPLISQIGAPNNGLVFVDGDIQVVKNSDPYFQFDQSGLITEVPWRFASAIGSGPDILLARDAAGLLSQRSGTTAQELRIYNTDSTADEFVSLGFQNNSNVFTIQTEQVGGATVRNIDFEGGNVGIGTTTPANTLSVNGLLYVGGAGTSTIEDNLDVLDTLHAKTSYTGDLIFANGFRFTEADLTSVNQALYLNSQFGSTTIAVLDNGNVGIGTTTPAYKLHVIGDVAATSFVNISTRSMKKDINYVGLEEQNGILNTIKGMRVAKYRYEFEDNDAPLRIGLIAEESPQEVLSASGGGVDIYKLSTFILSAVQAMQIDLEELTARVTSLEAGSSAFAGGVSIQTVLDYLASLGATITNGLAKFKDVIVSSLTIGSSDKPTGITLYDEVTGEPYCLSIASGITKTIAGVCLGLTTPPPSGGETDTTTVTTDTTPPTITVIGNNSAEIEIGSTYGDLGVTITDNVDSNLGYTASLDGGPELSQGDGLAIDTSVAGTHTITYKAVDNAGNIATAERVVNVLDPNATTTTGTASTTPSN